MRKGMVREGYWGESMICSFVPGIDLRAGEVVGGGKVGRATGGAMGGACAGGGPAIWRANKTDLGSSRKRMEISGHGKGGQAGAGRGAVLSNLRCANKIEYAGFNIIIKRPAAMPLFTKEITCKIRPFHCKQRWFCARILEGLSTGGQVLQNCLTQTLIFEKDIAFCPATAF